MDTCPTSQAAHFTLTPSKLAEIKPSRVAIFRSMGLGDMLCATPALRALRHALPEAHLTLVGLPWAKDFAQRFRHLVDDFMAFPGFPGLPEQPPRVRELPDFWSAAQRRDFDLAIQLHGSGVYSNPATALLGARRTAGFFLPGQYCPDEKLFLAYPDGLTEIHTLLRLTDFLGAPNLGSDLEFPVSPADEAEIQPVREALGSAYVLLHPGAAMPARRWTPEGFATVGDELARRGFAVALTGSASEASLSAGVASRMAYPALDLAGQTSLGGLGALAAAARLVVCNDTGISHVAAALRVRSVVIVLSSDPVRWAPLDSSLHRVIRHKVPCSPCRHAFCPIGDHPCSTGVQATDVIAAVDELLAEEPLRAA